MADTKKTRVHELLGVEPLEAFTVKGYSGKYYVDTCGAVRNNNDHGEGSLFMATLINDPSLILRRPTLTPDQREVLEALEKLGMKYLAVDRCGCIWAYNSLPELKSGSREWGYGDSDGHVSGPSLKCLLPLIPDWTVPLEIRKALGRE